VTLHLRYDEARRSRNICPHGVDLSTRCAGCGRGYPKSHNAKQAAADGVSCCGCPAPQDARTGLRS
jgi:hypothetical protein